MILGLIAASIIVQTFERDENGEYIRQEDGSLQAVDVTLSDAWITLLAATVGGLAERRVTATFQVWISRSAASEPGAEPVGIKVLDAAAVAQRNPEQQAWEALIAEVGEDHELISNGLPAWWSGTGHSLARIGRLLSASQHGQPIETIDYDKFVGLAFKDVWEHGMPTRRDGYPTDEVERYDPTGQPTLLDHARPVVSEYLIGRPDDPNAYKHLVWWRVGNDPANATFPGTVHPNVYAVVRRPPIGGDVEQRDQAWRDAALTRAMHVAAMGIIGYYAPQHPELDPTTLAGQRTLLDYERGYLAQEQQFFIARGGSTLYSALQASDKPWLSIPGIGGFATLRDRMLDELTPWAP
jgi:hypothetical protein